MKMLLLLPALAASTAAAGGWSGAIQQFERRPAAALSTEVVQTVRPPAGTVGVRPVSSADVNRSPRPLVRPVRQPAGLRVGLDRTAFTDTYNRSALIRSAARPNATPTFRRYYAPRGIPNGPAD